MSSSSTIDDILLGSIVGRTRSGISRDGDFKGVVLFQDSREFQLSVEDSFGCLAHESLIDRACLSEGSGVNTTDDFLDVAKPTDELADLFVSTEDTNSQFERWGSVAVRRNTNVPGNTVVLGQLVSLWIIDQSQDRFSFLLRAVVLIVVGFRHC